VDDLLSEKEQIEKMFGINYYQTQKVDAEIAASVLYDEITEHVVAGDLEAAEASAGALNGEYGNSSYAASPNLPWHACTWIRTATRTLRGL
jgi:predicted negative regulator of RcsB-dependent stress response